MAANQPERQFEALRDELDALDWHLLTALAIEGVLGATALSAIAEAVALRGGAAAIGDFVRRNRQRGMLADAGEVRSIRPRLTGLREEGWVVPPVTCQLVLRSAQARQSFSASVDACAAVLGSRSRARLVARIQNGSLVIRRDGDAIPPADVSGLLRESICTPFDKHWFERTWGARARAVATHVLRFALPGLDECSDLYEWARSIKAEDVEDELAVAVLQHALLRGDRTTALSWIGSLQARERFCFSAALQAMGGQFDVAHQLLEQGLAHCSPSHPRVGSLTPFLILLLIARGTAAQSGVAKSWLTGKRFPPELNGARRALRLLLRHKKGPDLPLKRLDPYQLRGDSDVWEVLVLSLMVNAFGAVPVTRSVWARALLPLIDRWSHGGYHWLAREADGLVKTLDPSLAASSPLGDDADFPLVLIKLVHAPAPWQRALSALEGLTVTELLPEKALRLQWFLDIDSIQILHPRLEKFTPGRGWVGERRLSIEEAHALQPDLPSEDRRVLAHIVQEPLGELRLASEAFDALVGHPRVADGMRREQPIEVVRNVCRIKVDSAGDFLTIAVEPAGLRLGVNVRVLDQSRISVVHLDPAMEKVVRALPEPLHVPLSESEHALEVVGRLAQSVEVFHENAGPESAQKADATPFLRVLPVAGAWHVQVGVRPFGSKGRFFLAGVGPPALTGWRDGRPLRMERDFRLEREAVGQLILTCALLDASSGHEHIGRAAGQADESWSLSGDEILVLLAQLRASGVACSFEWPESAPLHVRATVTPSDLRGRLRSNKGWYLVSGAIALDEVTELSLRELVRLPTLAKGQFVRLPTGDFVEIEARVRRILAMLRQYSQSGQREFRLPQSAGAALRELSTVPSLEMDGETQARLENFEKRLNDDFAVPSSFRATLRPYQHEGFRWLCCLAELGLGACLADDMGLGKTIQILAFMSTRSDPEPSLIVAPTSVCTNWMRELARFAPDLEAVEYLGSQRRELLSTPGRRVIVCSYSRLSEEAELLAKVRWSTLVFDEAQFIKNSRSQRARAAFTLNARYRIAATGTPVENRLGDLWSIFHGIQPDLLGSWEHFQSCFAKPIERNDDEAAREALSSLVRPYILRRKKSEVLKELPPLTVVRWEIVLSDQEQLRYALLRRTIHDKLRTVAGRQQNKLEVLAEITRLRRFCCHAQLVFPDAPSHGSKLDSLLGLVGELAQNGHQVLVFSQYVDFLALVRERLAEVGIAYEYLDGSVAKHQRQASIDAFQNGSAPLFLISLKAGGVGLNLTAANYVIHLDPWWNPSVEAQATDRAHRWGQSKPVTCYQFVTRDTIEEDILQLHVGKRLLSDRLLEGGDRVAGLSVEELITWLADGAMREPGAAHR